MGRAGLRRGRKCQVGSAARSVPLPAGRHYWGREIPSLLIFSYNVERFIPRVVLNLIEKLEFLLLRSDEHINTEFRQFLLDRGCPSAIVAQAGY
jgi:hypothetical protein